MKVSTALEDDLGKSRQDKADDDTAQMSHELTPVLQVGESKETRSKLKTKFDGSASFVCSLSCDSGSHVNLSVTENDVDMDKSCVIPPREVILDNMNKEFNDFSSLDGSSCHGASQSPKDNTVHESSESTEISLPVPALQTVSGSQKVALKSSTRCPKRDPLREYRLNLSSPTILISSKNGGESSSKVTSQKKKSKANLLSISNDVLQEGFCDTDEYKKIETEFSASSITHLEFYSLLGQRPRRLPKEQYKSGQNRSPCVISVGTVVGQSSCHTTVSTAVIKTASKSSHIESSPAAAAGNDDDDELFRQQLKLSKKKNRKSGGDVVKGELKYVWDSIKTPIRKIIKQDQVDLHRSTTGYLT